MIIKLYDFESINIKKLLQFLELEKSWLEREHNKSINDLKIAIFAHYYKFYNGIDKLEKNGFEIYNLEAEDLGTKYKNGNIITIKDIII